ncbi:glyoxalase [Mesorhizobium sp. M2D.F.Ca.ET.185.01.1.1]|uniref:VOC family protein n=1 Tax=unclassified Mesorhizobium TaxID=325217 RepID=UPI000FC9D406|nr:MULTISPECIES: VOC family protein [unclassified Mesorhizobium]TGP73909.1 glyoxalase [bacterium M00.F.Ca.ET.227.01.1.1]TGP85785.1 glyoxalase [bacterium M00.F.Ca.ET.221.01.1.1]TGP91012.1 glyoxalase [bacterium M00.F.Ca.ET.222.01.1.1]TGU03031.1 glyoxalase [bacterium M00.F.Ca.ET.163.01.1.1]TGU20263.1 glyoxalase [bacterium M00.F.Ca.ET.156.01.1.1]TGU44213.1 glyoxalase [bacterium M00.F.Ca.ET.146.01.1.1]TGV66111.1 glyoxalase [Mesorhizobium sp. M2D.F.Ca.ET.160.01.1.1]TGV81345.1 glyoxalase [Mesorhiz
MKTTSYYPVLMTGDVAGTADFYVTHFRFEPLFASDWYVHLRSSEDRRVNLGIVQGDHETIPQEGRGRTSGLLINFEVRDPDAVYERVVAAGLPILRTLRDEPFGQRHFITRDPNGVLIDVIKPIPPSEEFLAQYAKGAAQA